MTIEHIVLPGGGPNFPILYGAIKKLNMHDYWSMKNLKSIHGTSCGTIIGFVLLLVSLGIEWDDVDNYFINRPWENVYELSPEMLMCAFTDKGLVNEEHFATAFKPLMSTVELSIDATLKDLYDRTNIDFNLYITNFTDMKLDVLSHKTHPDIKIITAIHISSALPPVIQPVFLDDGKMYVDGGIFANNPIKQALEVLDEEDHSKLLGFNINYPEPVFQPIQPESNIVEYLIQLLSKLAWQCDPNSVKLAGPPKIDHAVIVTFKSVIKADFWNDIVSNSEFRSSLIKTGEEYADIYINYNN